MSTPAKSRSADEKFAADPNREDEADGLAGTLGLGLLSKPAAATHQELSLTALQTSDALDTEEASDSDIFGGPTSQLDIPHCPASIVHHTEE